MSRTEVVDKSTIIEVGDIVKRTKDEFCGMVAGHLGTVVKVDRNDIHLKEFEGAHYRLCLVVHKKAKDVAAKVFPDTPAGRAGLVVGSKIKYLDKGDTSTHMSAKVGDILELSGDDGSTIPFFKTASGKRTDFNIVKRKWEHYTEEEGVSVESTQKPAAREYQQGDHVKILANTNYHCYSIGSIVKLLSKHCTGSWGSKLVSGERVNSNGGFLSEGDIELYEGEIEIKPEHTAYVQFKPHSKIYAYKLSDELYQQIKAHKGVKLLVETNGYGDTKEEKSVFLANVKVNYVDPIATKSIKGIKGYVNGYLEQESGSGDLISSYNHVHAMARFQDIPDPLTIPEDLYKKAWMSIDTATEEVYDVQTNASQEATLTKKGDTNMTQKISRRIVNITILDEDKGIESSDALVFHLPGVVTEDSDEECFREILMNLNVAEALVKHNEKRAKIINRDVQQRTGNEVFLLPVRLKDLRVEVTSA